jgi:hypothetical protein
VQLTIVRFFCCGLFSLLPRLHFMLHGNRPQIFGLNAGKKFFRFPQLTVDPVGFTRPWGQAVRGQLQVSCGLQIPSVGAKSKPGGQYRNQKSVFVLSININRFILTKSKLLWQVSFTISDLQKNKNYFTCLNYDFVKASLLFSLSKWIDGFQLRHA